MTTTSSVRRTSQLSEQQPAALAIFRAPAPEVHWLQSTNVAQKFRIDVWQPLSRDDNSERFPVVYATDGDDFFGPFSTLANILQAHGETPRFILVTIGYGSGRIAGLLRRRDFYSHSIRALSQDRLELLAASPFVERMDLSIITQTTDAADFLRFIGDELMPYINDRYPTQPGDDTYFGFSAGGGFGLYTLFNDPSVFRRYVIGSPTASYRGHHFGIELARRFIDSGRSMEAKVFLCVGELEEFARGSGDNEFVTACYRLATFLSQAAIPGLELKLKVFPDETHATSSVLAFNHGLKALLGPAIHLPFWTTSSK